MFLFKNKLAYRPIAKNSSSFINKHLYQLGWQNIEINDIDSSFVLFVVLRDPFERWISGVVEDIITNIDDANLSQKVISEILDKDDWFLRWMFTTKTFHIEHHTELQTNSFTPSHFSNPIIYFKQENNLNFKLHHFLLGEGIKNNFLTLSKQNVKKDLPIYKKITEFLMDSKNIKYKQYLIEYLKPDYDLINSITFY